MKTMAAGRAPRHFLFVLALTAAWSCRDAVSAEPAGAAPSAAKDTFFIPHTHWEGAVFKTREEYLDMGLPGNNVAEGTMLLSLARSTRIQAYGYGGGYEPGMSSDTGFDLGRELTCEYALVPHAGDWRQAGVYRGGLEFNHPLLTTPWPRIPACCPNAGGSSKSPRRTSSCPR